MKYVFVSIFCFAITFLPWTIEELVWLTIVEIGMVSIIMTLINWLFNEF